ncbi:hypothetical protein [Alkalihalobacillus sp. BA299]|uniref:hypothetical protein n=1 Tax=Alkalihalobacillus sp. BA299 TaxID=2815938 RepID=UPI001ADA2479|nr:hypothetical protein [Alkalihalobacillus sp. BA299]
MEKRILEILLELQKGMKEVKSDIQEIKDVGLKEVKSDIQEIKDVGLKEVKTDIQEIKDVVTRIETSQIEDVVGMLKVTKKKTDFEFDYLNNKLTEIDKRLFSLEKRVEN